MGCLLCVTVTDRVCIDKVPGHVLCEGVHGHVGRGAGLELHVDGLVVADVVVALVHAPPVGAALQGLPQGRLAIKWFKTVKLEPRLYRVVHLVG